MELGLNLFWVALAVASFAVWRRQGPRWRGRRRYRSSLHGLITLGCALTVLFPVISLTDDLHAEQAAMEDSSSRSLKKWTGAETPSDLTKLANSPARIALPFLLSCCRRCVGQAVSTRRFLRGTVGTRPCEGRGPPTL
jgi:hypothetical protein